MENAYDHMKLDRQLCFPLYACSREVIKQYNPFLEALDLTYTQYLTMMVLWEESETNVKALGKKLFLDSGTLSSLLKKLESKGYLTRCRSKTDERNLIIQVTDKGMQLRDQAVNIPYQVAQEIALDTDEAAELYRLLYKILGK